jgi:hypothetical protein
MNMSKISKTFRLEQTTLNNLDLIQNYMQLLNDNTALVSSKISQADAIHYALQRIADEIKKEGYNV